MSFLTEFRRRNVPQVAIAYLAGAWLLIQVVETLLPIFGLSEDTARPVVIMLAIGFIPALILAWAFEWTPQGIRRDEGVAAATPRASTRGLDRAIIVLLALAVGYFAIDKFVIRPVPTVSLERSIIVLPFANLSSDPEQEYFGDGVAEDLLNLLSRIDELRVISRSTAWTFKDKDVDIHELHDKLDVSHILEGSVRKSGNQVRVTAQLIDARTDAHLWSETYDEQLDDIFAIQDRISTQIVNELRIQLLGDVPDAQKIDGHAYELFLQARYILNSDNFAAYADAQALLEQVVEVEPNFVPALFELGRAVFLSAWRSGDEEAKKRAQKIVERMAEIAPQSSYTNSAQSANASVWGNDLQAAALHLERAIADNPHNPPQVLTQTATLLAQIGRSAEAYAVARYNSARDPACTFCAYMLARIARQSGHQAEAVEYLEKMMDWHPMSPNLSWQLGAALLSAGEPQRALRIFEDHSDDPGLVLVGRLMALHDLGRTAEFEAEFAEFREAATLDDSEFIARVYAWTGQNDAAFEYLDKMIERYGPASSASIKNDLYSRLSADPRYEAFLEKHGQSDQDHSHIRFDPPYPPAMRAEVERFMASIESGKQRTSE